MRNHLKPEEAIEKQHDRKEEQNFVVQTFQGSVKESLRSIIRCHFRQKNLVLEVVPRVKIAPLTVLAWSLVSTNGENSQMTRFLRTYICI